MSIYTTRYDKLLDLIISECLPKLNHPAPFLIEIKADGMELETIRRGVINAKAAYVKTGKLQRAVQLIFVDPKLYTTDKKFKGFAVLLRSYNKLRASDI